MESLKKSEMHLYFDIETSGLERNSFLLQLSAISEKQDKFDIYIRPPCPLSQECTSITGLSFVSNILFKDGVPLHTVGLYPALNSFRHWTDSLIREERTLDLIGYNSNAFDVPFLVKAYSRFDQTLPDITSCYDVLPSIRKMQRNSDKLDKLAKSTIRLEDLGALFIPDSDIMKTKDFHNSLYDCEILKQVTEQICKDKKTDIDVEFGFYKKPFDYFVNKYYNKRQF